VLSFSMEIILCVMVIIAEHVLLYDLAENKSNIYIYMRDLRVHSVSEFQNASASRGQRFLVDTVAVQ